MPKLHFYTFATNDPTKPKPWNKYVGACDARLYEDRDPPHWNLPEGFYFGTEFPENVTCGRCMQTKKYKQALKDKENE